MPIQDAVKLIFSGDDFFQLVARRSPIGVLDGVDDVFLPLSAAFGHVPTLYSARRAVGVSAFGLSCCYWHVFFL